MLKHLAIEISSEEKNRSCFKAIEQLKDKNNIIKHDKIGLKGLAG
jgi:hypothetical protein